jgi:co-chaperonin GroES (HSP10)
MTTDMKMSQLGPLDPRTGILPLPDSGVPSSPLDLSKLYVEPKERVLDPALIEQSLLDRLPQPTGWRVLVMPFAGRARTSGGLIVPDEVRSREALATVVAYVLRVGPLAFKDPDKFGPPDASGHPVPWCREKQWVCIGRYSGSRFRIDGGEVRIINDDEIIATILDPEDIHNV